MKKIVRNVTGNDEKDAWHFIGQVWRVQDAAGCYLGGKLSEKKLMFVLLHTLLKMHVICQHTIDRGKRKNARKPKKNSQETMQRLARGKRG